MKTLLNWISIKHVIAFTIALGIINAGWLYVYQPNLERQAVAPVALQLAEAQKQVIKANAERDEAYKHLEASRARILFLTQSLEAVVRENNKQVAAQN